MKKIGLMLLFLLSGCSHFEVEPQKEHIDYQSLSKVDLSTAILERMSLEDKVYQSFIIGFNGTSMSPQLQDYADHQLGGVLLFNRNIQSAVQVRELNAQLASAGPVPMFISVDQEGGRVNRLPAELGNTEAAFYLSSLGSQTVKERAVWTGQTLKDLNFNLDFAPVLDIWTNPANQVIGDRSFGTTAGQVTEMAGAFNKGLHQAGIVTSAKHFPGHGDTFADSHKELPVNYKTVEQLKSVELQPYMQLKNELDMVMVSHIVINELDSAPSSLSKAVVTDLLQHEIGYNGVTVTDDLAMGAITQHYTETDAVVKALMAGETMVLVGNDSGNLPMIVDEVVRRVKAGEINQHQLDKNVEKILRLKAKYDIL